MPNGPAVPALDRSRRDGGPRRCGRRCPLLRDRQRARPLGERARARQMVTGLTRVSRLAGRQARLTRRRKTISSLTLRTLGHACLALYREGEAPVLITDPWLLGSVYWRSWWLQHYP